MLYRIGLLALLVSGCSMLDSPREVRDQTPTEEDPGGHDCDGGNPDPTQPGACGVEVHVIGVYTPTTCDEEHVTIDRAGEHVLVLSSYEHAKWVVDVASGAHVDRVFAIGYHEQEVVVNQDGAQPEISTSSYDAGTELECGYSWPYNGEGCDTNGLLDYTERATGDSARSFHGCYQANEWTLNEDMSVTSDCDTASGDDVEGFANACTDDPPPPPAGDPTGFDDWTAFDFPTAVETECTGQRFVRYDARYGEYVGAIVCHDLRHYKLLMSDTKEGPYLELADWAGYGQDQCELVSSTFTIPDEDDIAKGCPECSISPDFYDPQGDLLFSRGYFGEPFDKVVGSFWTELAPYYIGCGVEITASK